MIRRCFLIMLLQTVWSEVTEEPNGGSCVTDKLKSGWERVICENVTVDFLESTNMNFSKTQWFACGNCSLQVLDEYTFNFPNNRITFVKLSRNGIKRLNRFSFHKLPLTKQLILRENDIEDIRPEAFNRLKKILQLDLSKNKLTKLNNKMFGELENLDVLNLNSNSVNIIEDDAFLGLGNLKYLYLNYNKLYAISSNLFRYLRNLKILYLENNFIKEIHPLAFNDLVNLNYLYLNNNSINYLVQYNFKSMVSLIDLQMSHNNLVEIQTSSFNGLNSLRYLYLSHNKIELVKPYGLIGLNNLLLLDLIGNNFQNFALDSFKDMRNLHTLWLRNNEINNFTITKHADELINLKILDLLNNNLSYFNFKMLLYKVPNLNEILLNEDYLQCDFFIDMYDYCTENNVTICLDENCRVNKTEEFLESECFNFENTTTIDYPPTDYVLNCTCVSYHLKFYLILFVSVACYYF